MSLVTVPEVQALVSTELADADLQDVIDREEEELASHIGPLIGERTQVFFPISDEPIRLLRRTNTVTLTNDGTPVVLGDADGEYRLVGGSVLLLNSGWWGGVVTAAYTPNDELRVKRVLIELIRLTTTETGYVSERIGQYSYSKPQQPGAAEQTRSALIRSLLPNLGAHSIRLRSSVA